MDMRCLISLVENHSLDFASMIRNAAWVEFESNVRQNENELEDLIADYEDETDEVVHRPRGRENERGIELLDPGFLEWCQQRVARDADGLAIEYENLIEDGCIRAWRAVEETPDWDVHTEARPHVHWSRTKDKAQAIFGIGEQGHVVHIIEALLPVASIDWEATIGANLSQEFGEDEDEIVLKQGAPFHIVSVTNEDGAKNIKEADENCDEITKEDKELFLVGYCHALAIAIQELAGNSIVVILADDGEEIRPAHVINRYADDEFIDIRGVIDGGEAIQDIGLDGDDYEFVDISAAALERFYSKRHNGLLRPSAEIMARARAVAKILLPGDIKRGRR